MRRLRRFPHRLLGDPKAIGSRRGWVSPGLEWRRRTETSNHVGIIHAGVVSTLAETTSGVNLRGAVPAAVVLLRPVAVRHRRPAEDYVIVEARFDPAAARELFAAAGTVDCPSRDGR